MEVNSEFRVQAIRLNAYTAADNTLPAIVQRRTVLRPYESESEPMIGEIINCNVLVAVAVRSGRRHRGDGRLREHGAHQTA